MCLLVSNKFLLWLIVYEGAVLNHVCMCELRVRLHRLKSWFYHFLAMLLWTGYLWWTFTSVKWGMIRDNAFLIVAVKSIHKTKRTLCQAQYPLVVDPVIVLISFPFLWQNTWDNLLKRGSWFQRFQTMVSQPCYSGPMAKQYIITRAHGRKVLFTSWYSRSKERDTGRGCGSNILFKHTLPMTWLPPMRPHFLKVPPLPVAPRSRDQAVNTWAYGEHFQTIALLFFLGRDWKHYHIFQRFSSPIVKTKKTVWL